MIKERKQDITTEEKLIYKIIKRAEEAGYVTIVSDNSREYLAFILKGANNIFDLKLKEWFESDDLRFVIDFNGLLQNYHYQQGVFDFGNFVPRFATKK